MKAIINECSIYLLPLFVRGVWMILPPSLSREASTIITQVQLNEDVI